GSVAVSFVAGVRSVGVVLFPIDFIRQTILLAIDLSFFRSGQFAAVGSAIRLYFTVDCRLFGFEIGRFSGGELAALYTLRDAVLLVLSTLADFAFRLRIARGRLILRERDRSNREHQHRQNTALLPFKVHGSLP